MNEDYLKFWKGSLTIAAAVVAAITGYKTIFGKELATRTEERRIAVVFPHGQPNSEIMQRQVTAATPYVGLEFSLKQFSSFLASRNLTLAWEPVDTTTFVLRASGIDVLTAKPAEWAFQFVLLEGPFVDGRLIGTFAGPAVGIESMAVDHQVASEMTLALTLAEIVEDVRRQPR